MMGRFVKQAVLFCAAILMILLQFGQVWAEENKTGVVVEIGLSGVMVQGPGDSEGIKFNTGRETVYTPSDYNPDLGDTVTVVYYPKQLPSGEVILAVSSLTLVKMSPNHRELSNPAQGTVIEVGRKMIRFSFPKTGQELSMDRKRGMDMVPGGWTPVAGDQVLVSYDKVKSRFTGRMIYVMSRLEKLN